MEARVAEPSDKSGREAPTMACPVDNGEAVETPAARRTTLAARRTTLAARANGTSSAADNAGGAGKRHQQRGGQPRHRTLATQFGRRGGFRAYPASCVASARLQSCCSARSGRMPAYALTSDSPVDNAGGAANGASIALLPHNSAAAAGFAHIQPVVWRQRVRFLSLIHISEPTRRTPISYAVFCLKKKKKK